MSESDRSEEDARAGVDAGDGARRDEQRAAEAEDAQREETTDELLEAALNHHRRQTRDRGGALSAAHGREDDQLPVIEGNPFHAAVFQGRDPEQVKEVVAAQLCYDISAEQKVNRERLVAFEGFRAWLMEQRKDLAQQIINLTDTDAFSELKGVFDDMNRGMLEFERQMKPLTDILDAVYRLRTASGGEILDVLQEIQEDQEADLENQKRKRRMAEEVEKRRARIKSLQHEIDVRQGDRAWFGMGDVTKKAQKRIEELQAEVASEEQAIAALRDEIDKPDPVRESRFEEFAADKAKLRELLDIGSEGHRRRQEELVESANRFVDTAQTRSNKVLAHLERINQQVELLGEGNAQLREVYAVISEAVQDAEGRNIDLRDELAEAPENENSIATLKRTNTKMAVEDHITALVTAKADTIETFGDLTAESYRIKSIRDSNNNQVARTRALSTKGVAGVAGRLSTVLQGVSTAALGESSEIAKQTLARMNEQTTRFSHKEALKNAMSVNVDNAALVQAVEELEGYAKVARAATEISRGGLEDMKDNLAKLQETLEDVTAAVQEAVAISADVVKEGRIAQRETERLAHEKPAD
ncbi:MAG: hypothetical protein V2J24_07855 [Pseudomonadales bacterium]|jgi:hypothetical protein|nr:hypothetical protein [Pseudomonadales bacterium]